MQLWVQLLLGEKDGQRFHSPWVQDCHPEVFWATADEGDQELLAYRGETPPGRKEELSILAYRYARRVAKGRDFELQYERVGTLDGTKGEKTTKRHRRGTL